MPRAPKPKFGLFHTTSYANLERIAREGLDPQRSGSLFRHGGYSSWARGKVFLAEGRQAALGWYGKVQDMLADRAPDNPDAADVVPVLLEITLPRGMQIQVDDVGGPDVLGAGSWYVEAPIPPQMISFWDPVSGEWADIEDWESVDVSAGVSETEFFDENGDPTDDEESAESTAFGVFGPYDDGGFKPNRDNDDAWDDDEVV